MGEQKEREHCDQALGALFHTDDILVTEPNGHTWSLLVDLLIRERAAARAEGHEFGSTVTLGDTHNKLIALQRRHDALVAAARAFLFGVMGEPLTPLACQLRVNLRALVATESEPSQFEHECTALNRVADGVAKDFGDKS